MMKTAIERLFDARIHYYARIRCKNKVNAGRWRFVKWVGLSVIWVYPTVNVMVSSSLPILSLGSKE